ncbi:MAG TPA: molybdate ABC transporter substrate-binding protein [Steroidobacteraceae bacterium]|nr:molybdate ABC transporter substrate-binding protein [Steroidobacteraceae bacterium]
MSNRRRLLASTLAAALAVAVGPSGGASASPAEGPLLVFAAASLTNALNEIGPLYTRRAGKPVTFSFAASSTLARQIAAGAEADVFFSADMDWMDFLQSRHLVDSATRRNIVGNRLALISPSGSQVRLAIHKGFDLAGALGRSGRLAVGEPQSVPAGRYARDALGSLGVWPSVADRLIPSENVRAALSYVARGEAPLGIVYETDALIEPRVRIVGLFPPSSHPSIDYPAAVVAPAHGGPPGGRTAEANRFVRFLASPEAQQIFHKYGFLPP